MKHELYLLSSHGNLTVHSNCCSLAQVTHLHAACTFHCRECGTDLRPQFMCPGDQVIFTCRVFGSSSLEWRSPLITQTTPYIASATPPMILNCDPLTVSLISVSGTPLNANFTSTLAINISAGECEFHLRGRCTMTLTKIHTVDTAHYLGILDSTDSQYALIATLHGVLCTFTCAVWWAV